MWNNKVPYSTDNSLLQIELQTIQKKMEVIL